MKVKLESAINRNDCYRIGIAIAELRCSLSGASHELGEGDMSWAKTYLYDAEAQGRVLSALLPNQPPLKGLLRDLSKTTKEVLIGKPRELRKKVIKLREETLKLRERTQAYCSIEPGPAKKK